MLDKELINDIKNHADIVQVISTYISLTKKGKDYVAKCPFHDDHNPSLTVSPEKQYFKCWVCGTAGTVFNFVEQYEKISFIEAVRKVADIISYHDDRLLENKRIIPVDKTKQPIYDCLNDLTAFYQYSLNSVEGEKGLDYLTSRNINQEIIETFNIGYAINDGNKTIRYLQEKGHSLKTIEDTGISSLRGNEYFDKNEGRVIFPLADRHGQIVGYSARRLDDNSDVSKYINSPETQVFHKSNILYNYHNAKNSVMKDKYVYVLEGFMDVIALAKAGISSAVALMGTSLTNEHIMLLRKLNVEVRLSLDSDFAGQDATLRAAKLFVKENIPFRIVKANKNAKDPDVIINSEGKEALINKLNDLISFNDFLIYFYTEVHHLTQTNEKKLFIKEMLPFLLSIKSQLDYEDYIQKISKITGYDDKSLKSLVAANRKFDGQNIEKSFASFHPERKALKRLAVAESEILYQMLYNKNAVEFYKNNVKGFYDETYRCLANYIIEAYSDEGNENSLTKVINIIDSYDDPNKETLKKELIDLDNIVHPTVCDEALLNGCLTTIVKEKERMSELDKQALSFEGKDEKEKARILRDINNRKRQQLKPDMEEYNDGKD